MNIRASLALISSNAIYKIQKKNLNIKGISIVKKDEMPSILDGLKSLEHVTIAYISNIATQIIYNGLLVELGIKKGYCQDFRSLVEESLSIDEGALQDKVLKHICSTFISAFKDLDLAVVDESKEMRFILKKIQPGGKIILNDDVDSSFWDLNEFLSSKKVMILSPRADLIKVQFVRLKNDDRYKDKYRFNMYAIDPISVIESADRSLYFESLDALKMAILTYEFDVLLIRDEMFDLPITQFVAGLNKTSIAIDNSIYSIFNIVNKNKDVSQSDSLTMSLENFDKEISKQSSEAKFTSRKKRGE